MLSRRAAAEDCCSLQGPYLAGYQHVDSVPISYGIQRVDHAVGNVHCMKATLDYIKHFSGFHEFAEFTSAVSRLQGLSCCSACLVAVVCPGCRSTAVCAQAVLR